MRTKNNGIAVGPGLGSDGASIVTYAPDVDNDRCWARTRTTGSVVALVG
ncbi:hypothetical protein [Streptomyces sp. NBC_01324]